MNSLAGKFETLEALIPYMSRQKLLLLSGLIGMAFGAALSLFVGFAIKYAVESFPEDAEAGVQFLNELVLIAVVVIVAGAIVSYVATYSLRKATIRIVGDLRNDTFDNIVHSDIAYLETQNSGYIQTRVVSDPLAIGNFLAMQLPVALTASMTLIGGLGGAFIISDTMATIVLSFLPIIFLPFLLFGSRLRALGRSVQAAQAETGRVAGETVRNIKVVQAYNQEREESSRFSRTVRSTVECSLSAARLQLGISKVVGALTMISFAVLLYLACLDIYRGGLTLGQLSAFAYFTTLIVTASGRLLGILISLNVLLGKAEKLVEFLRIERHRWPSRVRRFESQGEILFRDVEFKYPSRPEIEVLKGVTLHVKPGSYVALVGSSGAGKSTLFELLLKFYKPTRGNIYLDGIDCEQLDDRQLRNVIGYVPQMPRLIAGTVLDNMRYGTESSDTAIQAAARTANAHEFIMALPNGYETDIGEIGDRLSGGQCQRIALARALIRKPAVLLLDEAKSALDAESSNLVEHALVEWARENHTTIIAITHRVETARLADEIVVMENGRIVNRGRYRDLIGAPHGQLEQSMPTHGREESACSVA